MLRDTRKSKDYFNALLPQYLEGIENLHHALDDGSMPLPDEQTFVANDIFELTLMYTIACYSAGEPLHALKPKVAEILKAKKLYFEKAATLPARQQVYREQFEKISGKSEAGETHYITRYINVLWWLSLAVTTQQPQDHCLEILSCIGNRGEDTLLDRIAIALGDENQILAPNLLYPHLYRPLLSAFDASPSQQIMYVNAFLKDWYSNCWQAAWYNNHNKENAEGGNWDFYFGYWSLEAALVANLLNVDTTSFKDHWHYPADMSL